MVSIPKAERDIKAVNHFVPGPSLYKYEDYQNNCKIPIKMGTSQRKVFQMQEGPGPGIYDIANLKPPKGIYMGQKIDDYAIPQLKPGPADYQPQKVLTSAPQYSMARRRSLSPRSTNYEVQVSPAYYNPVNQSMSTEKNVQKFPKSKRQFFNIISETPGPQKYQPESKKETSKYSFPKDKRNYEYIGGQSQSPGPGSYLQNTSTLQKQGGSVRKEKYDEKTQKQGNPGPGSYRLEQNILNAQRGACFTKGKRNVALTPKECPGPAQYRDLDVSQYKKRFPAVMIGTSRRVEEYQDQIPGPGNYNLAQETFDRKRQRVFIIGKSKDYLDIKHKIQTPSPDKYSNQNDDDVKMKGITFPHRLRDYQQNPLDVIPGPGHYGYSQKPIAYRFAYANSKRSEMSTSNTPGPSYYKIVGSIDQSVAKAKQNK